MIYYSTQRVLLTAGHESQCIHDAIQRGLTEISTTTGISMLLSNVIPVVVPGWLGRAKICLVILAKPYEPEKPQGILEDLLGQAMRVEGGKGIIEKIGAVLGKSGKIEEKNVALSE